LFLVIYGYLPPTIATTAYQVFTEACAPAPSYWLITLLVTVAALTPAFIYKAFQTTFFPNDDQIIQELSLLKKDRDWNWLARALANTTLRVTVGITARFRQRKHKTWAKKPNLSTEGIPGTSGKASSSLTTTLLEP
jgi:magnesium-transporting ATPase (P-type)